jgi:hypothetical protein
MMQPKTDLIPFMEMLDATAEQYGKTLSDGLKELYWNGLKGYDFAAVQSAFGRHIANPDTGMFMPKIADIVKMLQGSSQDSAYAAWTRVDKAIRSVGTYATVIFDDPLIHRTISDMGGWIAIGSKKESDWPFVAKEFETRYRGMKQLNVPMEYPSQLIGVEEMQNGQQGFRSAPPVLIGNPEKCRLIASKGSDNPALQITASAPAKVGEQVKLKVVK